jgi:hypothetical protein
MNQARCHTSTAALLLFALACLAALGADRALSGSSTKITLGQVLASPEDLWGNAAMQEPNGPCYKFFESLLPPLRYVNASFRYYPIALSAPGAIRKARLVSNGSAINARAELGSWDELGIPVAFQVGKDQTSFGSNPGALDGPVYAEGFLPIVQLSYRHAGAVYGQETFAAVGSGLAEQAVLFTRFTLQAGRAGRISAHFGTNVNLRQVDNTLRDTSGRIVSIFEPAWQWNPTLGTLSAVLAEHSSASLAIATVPSKDGINNFSYDDQRRACVEAWQGVLSGAGRVQVPEPLVNNAWKSSVLGLFTLMSGDRMNYSAGNIYKGMYEAESGDAVRALMLWGLLNQGRRLIPPLLDYAKDPGLRFHDAAFKLQMLAHYFALSGDAQFLQDQRPHWSRAAAILMRERDPLTGLLPREAYCGDEAQKVFSLNSNANAWRGLRDLAVALAASGNSGEVGPISTAAEKLRKALETAVDQSERRDVVPCFLPVALFGEEQPYDVLTATRRGSYWNLVMPYVLGSSFFGPGSARETSMVQYFQQHGGLCMGLVRFHQHSGLFANEDAVDDLYTLRYVDTVLRRDEPDRALVSFYGKLAQGMTRGTFLSAEGTGLRPLDQWGRPMYLPPNSSGNAFFLSMLRNLLVQDQDLDNDGRAETLRLLFATPRAWLEDGKQIVAEGLPTAFGQVSLRVDSRLSQGRVIAMVDLPPRAPKKFLRLRLPAGWKMTSATCEVLPLKADPQGTLDLSALSGQKTIQVHVSR